MRSNKLFLGVLVGAGLLAAFWFLILAPKREDITALEARVSTKQQEIAASEATLGSYRAARDSYKQTYARLAGLGKAVPADDDMRSLVVQLDAAAKANKVNFRSIAVAASGGASPAASATAPVVTPPPGAVSSGSAGFSTMPLTLTFAGDYAHLSALFTDLERFVAVRNEEIRVTGRLMRVDSITLIPKPGFRPGSLQADVSASTFLVPPAQAVAGAATPDASAAGTTPAAEGSTPTATTAAVTGAIE